MKLFKRLRSWFWAEQNIEVAVLLPDSIQPRYYIFVVMPRVGEEIWLWNNKIMRSDRYVIKSIGHAPTNHNNNVGDIWFVVEKLEG